MVSSITIMASSSTSRLLSKKTHLPIPLPKPSLSLPQLPKPSLSLPPTLTVAVAAAASPPPTAVEIEKAALFEFNLTLPAIAVEFLLFMVALDKIYFTPLGKFMDERDAAIRDKLGGVKDTSAEVKKQGTLQFLIAMGDRFEHERARYNEFFQIFMDFKDVDKRVDGDEIIRRTEELFDGEEIMVMGFYNLMLDTKRKSRKPDDLGEVFNRVLEMMHQNQDYNPEQNITQENQDSQAEIDESSMTDLYKSKVRSKKKRKRNNSKVSASTPMDDTSRKCGSSSNKETPSYKLLREPTSLRSSNSPELDELNDSCYLAIKCNRNTIRKINKYEQTLFDCEDDMFEFDMLLGRVKATTRKLEEEIEKNPDGQNFIKLIKLESTTNFNSSNLRCLLNFYNCGVAKIMDSIREDPTTELQRIYEDMKHWSEVLLEQRKEVRKICKDVFAELS